MTEKIVERIQMLLKKAESTTPEEAEALTAAAEKLMIKHGIDRATAEASGRVKKEEIVQYTIDFPGQWQTAWVNGFSWVVRAMGLRPLQARIHTGEMRMWIIGFESDAREVLELIESLKTQSENALNEWWKSTGLPYCKMYGYTNHQRHVEKRSFMESFGEGAASRIRKEREVAVEESVTGTDIVLRDRSKMVDDFVDVVLNPGKARGGHSYGSAGIYAGFEAGVNSHNGKKIESRKQVSS